MIRRFFGYCNKVFRLAQLMRKIEDGRMQPQIAGQAIWQCMFVLFGLRLGSLNALEEMLRDPGRRGKWSRFLGESPPSADTIGYFAERVVCDSLRWVLHAIYTQLQRNRHITRFRIGGWTALALDGHELFASYHRHCQKCCTRTIKSKKRERTQYYHRIVVAHLVGGPIPILLDAEEVRAGEGEIAAARRLLERVQRRYPKAYDVVTADALYADPRIVSFLHDHHKHLIAVLKDNHPDLLEDARSLCAPLEPTRWKQGKNEYAWWDTEGLLTWSSIKAPVRVVRSQETKPSDGQRVTTDWFWITTFSSQEALTEIIWRIGHNRWDIENDGFNYLCMYYNFNHAFRHHPNAILAFVLTAFIVYVLVSAFYHLNLKPPARRYCCLTTLTRKFWITLESLLAAPPKDNPIRASP